MQRGLGHRSIRVGDGGIGPRCLVVKVGARSWNGGPRWAENRDRKCEMIIR